MASAPESMHTCTHTHTHACKQMHAHILMNIFFLTSISSAEKIKSWTLKTLKSFSDTILSYGSFQTVLPYVLDRPWSHHIVECWPSLTQNPPPLSRTNVETIGLCYFQWFLTLLLKLLQLLFFPLSPPSMPGFALCHGSSMVLKWFLSFQVGQILPYLFTSRVAP